jgi:O-antigen/teichoic acid export membrane protein
MMAAPHRIGADEMGGMAKGTAAVLGATAFGLGLNYLYGICLARALGAEAFGEYALGLALFNLFSVFATMGLDHALLQFIPRAARGADGVKAPGIVATGVLLGIGAGCIGGALLLLLGIAVRPGAGAREFSLFLPFAVAVPAQVLSTLVCASLQALRDVRRRLAAKYLIEPVVRFAATFVLLRYGWGVGAASAGLVGALLAGTASALPLLVRRVAPDRDAGPLRWRLFLRFSLPLLVGIAVNAVATRSDVLLIGSVHGPLQAGLYAAALQTASTIILGLAVVESVLAPRISEAIAGGDRAALRELYALSLRWALFLGTPLLVLFLPFASDLMSLFGERFREVSGCFAILAAAKFLDLATGSANCVLLLSGMTGQVTKIETAAGIFQAALGVAVIPRFGPIGAAVVLLLTTVLANLARLGVAFGRHRIHPFHRDLARPAAAAAAAIVFALVARRLPTAPSPALLAPATLLLYCLLFVASGAGRAERAAVSAFLARGGGSGR